MPSAGATFSHATPDAAAVNDMGSPLLDTEIPWAAGAGWSVWKVNARLAGSTAGVGGGFRTVRVTLTAAGLAAPVAVISTTAEYVPASSDPGLTRTPNEPPVLPAAGLTISHGAAGGAEAAKSTAGPVPLRFTSTFCSGGSAPPD
jgi:hypothetical protein